MRLENEPMELNEIWFKHVSVSRVCSLSRTHKITSLSCEWRLVRCNKTIKRTNKRLHTEAGREGERGGGGGATEPDAGGCGKHLRRHKSKSLPRRVYRAY